MQPYYVHIFVCTSVRVQTKDRNFSKPFKLIQEIVTQEVEKWKNQTEWWGIPEISNSRKLLPLRARGTQGRGCFVEMRSWGHPKGAWIMVESPRGSCATEGGAVPQSWSISAARDATKSRDGGGKMLGSTSKILSIWCVICMSALCATPIRYNRFSS